MSPEIISRRLMPDGLLAKARKVRGRYLGRRLRTRARRQMSRSMPTTKVTLHEPGRESVRVSNGRGPLGTLP
jgi:hypothetical protein